MAIKINISKKLVIITAGVIVAEDTAEFIIVRPEQAVKPPVVTGGTGLAPMALAAAPFPRIRAGSSRLQVRLFRISGRPRFVANDNDGYE